MLESQEKIRIHPVPFCLQVDQKSWDLTDGVMIALTEVFHSCFISEQRAGEKSYVESGYICLSKEQIMNQVPSNLLATFFTGVRAVKKTLAEQVQNKLTKGLNIRPKSAEDLRS